MVVVVIFFLFSLSAQNDTPIPTHSFLFSRQAGSIPKKKVFIISIYSSQPPVEQNRPNRENDMIALLIFPGYIN